MNHRERFVACATGQKVDRAPFWVFWGPWGSTWRRWEKEGMPALASWDAVRATFGPDVPPRPIPVNYGPCPAIPPKVIEQNDQWYIHIDSWGIKRRNFRHTETMSEFLEFPVKNRRDWEAFREQYLNPDDPRRLDGDWLAKCQEWTRLGYPIQIGNYPDVGVFGSLRWLLGDEECLLAFYTDPALVHEIMDHMTDVWLAVFEKVMAAGVRPDMLHIWEDMCGRQGPLISPKHWEEFMGPCYRRMRDFARRHDIPVIAVDTDGWCEPIIPPMMAGGVNMVFPMEVQAGMDVNEVQRKYPTLAMMGGIDKRALAHGRAAIDAELARIAPAIRRGRYVPELDHTMPDDISWPDFVYYIGRLKQMIGVE